MHHTICPCTILIFKESIMSVKKPEPKKPGPEHKILDEKEFRAISNQGQMWLIYDLIRRLMEDGK